MEHNRFEDRYQSGNTPWDHGMVDYNLIEAVATHQIASCRTLDIGCGTGENAIWLSQQGFAVIACDLSPTAIKRAKEKQAAAKTEVCFVVADILKDPIPDAPFGFVFDRGCLHCMSEGIEREAYVKQVAALLGERGYWLSLVGNADEGEREVGPPQLTALELVSVVEPQFEILSLVAGLFGSDQESPPRAWICLMRKRKTSIAQSV